MDQTFTLSNISPQVGQGFNRWVWMWVRAGVDEVCESMHSCVCISRNVSSLPNSIGRVTIGFIVPIPLLHDLDFKFTQHVRTLSWHSGRVTLRWLYTNAQKTACIILGIPALTLVHTHTHTHNTHTHTHANAHTHTHANAHTHTRLLCRDYWARFEQFIRGVTRRCQEVRVVTGPLWLPSLEDGKWSMRHDMIGESGKYLSVLCFD